MPSLERLPLLLILLIAAPTEWASAQSGICEPELWTLPNVVATPAGNLPTVIILVGPGGPLVGYVVEYRYGAPSEAEACWCSGQAHPTLSGVTDEKGQVVFQVRGGRCIDTALFPGENAITVYVNGEPCAQRGQVSPDIVSPAPGTCQVSLADAVNFTGPLSTGTYDFCHDLNGDLGVGLSDAILFTQSASVAASCPD